MFGKVGRFIDQDSTAKSFFVDFIWNLFDLTTSQRLLQFKQ